jgi:hypothetical protein
MNSPYTIITLWDPQVYNVGRFVADSKKLSCRS